MNDARRPLPFGSWPSPITAARLVEGSSGVSEIRADGADIWWNEQRPSEGGRYQLVHRGIDGTRRDLFPPWDPDGPPHEKWNARTAVLEYGGGAWTVRDGVVVFANWSDQRLYRVDPDGAPVAISPAPSVARGWRWSEPTWLDERSLVCVRESHEPGVVAEHGEAMNELVVLPVDGSAVEDPSLVQVLVSGPDFVHSPAVGGDTLAWVQWHHPKMPWDGSELCTARIVRGSVGPSAGRPTGLEDVSTVAGGPTESIVQPGFTDGGDLVFCTDRTGWWNPWRLPEGGAQVEPVLAGGGIEGEIGGGLWVGGLRWWAELGDGRLVVTLSRDGADGLAIVGTNGHLTALDTPFTEVSQVVASGDGEAALVVAGSPVSESTPYRITVSNDSESAGSVGIEALRPGRILGFGTDWFSVPRHVSFPSAGGRMSHALVYPPTNPDAEGPKDERAPLVVMIHGGPTSAARHRLDLAKQFWTSRGFAVADVNYGGSTGYGRPYRELLNEAWGVVDVEDAVAVARHLADEGLVDSDRLAIRGGSAGGFTTLAALCFHQTFRAGASHYGVADLTALATDTHKFESRYLDTMVGPWPAARARYEERSPINHTDGFNAPLIVLQGSEDEVVPPNQAEMIVHALLEKGVPHAYLLFEGEQHGFRQAANIVRALEAELWFYGRVFGFTPNDPIVAVEGAYGL